MSVILLLVLFVIWMSWSPAAAPVAVPLAGWGPAVFWAGYAVLVLAVAGRDRWMLQRAMRSPRALARLRRGGGSLLLPQLLVPAWLWVGLTQLGWGEAVQRLLGPMARWNVQSPGLVLGLLPAFGAWAGLWWAHYPVYRALREQNLLLELEAELPVYAPPTLIEYVTSRLRMQLLFTAVPVLMIVLLRDIGTQLVVRGHLMRSMTAADVVVSVAAALAVYLVAPELLRRVLSTQRLPDPHLRRQLTEMASRDGVRCRDVLLWNTHHSVGNAAVMGIIRPFRYVMLSDLLLESLPDEHVLAVFAHELGHVVHRHMIWYGVFLVGLSLAFVGVGDAASTWAQRWGASQATIDQVTPLASVLLFVLGFGYVSRRFERQADMHAARTMQALADAATYPAGVGNADRSTVGPAGAAAFNGALRRISAVNHIPLGARGSFTGSLRQRASYVIEWTLRLAGSWLHGTMLTRMRYITAAAADPAITKRFDQQMLRLRAAIVLMLIGCAVWAGVVLHRGNDGSLSPADAAAAGLDLNQHAP